jgi:hypothetical protein
MLRLRNPALSFSFFLSHTHTHTLHKGVWWTCKNTVIKERVKTATKQKRSCPRKVLTGGVPGRWTLCLESLGVKAEDDEDVRFQNKSANFPIHLSRAQPSSVSAKWPICEPWLLGTKSCYLLVELGTAAEQCTLAFLLAAGKFTISAIVPASVRVHYCFKLLMSAVCSEEKAGWGEGCVSFNYSNTCRILQP